MTQRNLARMNLWKRRRDLRSRCKTNLTLSLYVSCSCIDKFTSQWMECTADVSKGIPLQALMSTLKVHGRLIIVGLPDENLPAINSARMFLFCLTLWEYLHPLSRAGAEWLLHWRKSYVCISSNITLLLQLIRYYSGSKEEVIRMLNLAVEKKVKSYIEILPSKATIDLKRGDSLTCVSQWKNVAKPFATSRRVKSVIDTSWSKSCSNLSLAYRLMRVGWTLSEGSNVDGESNISSRMIVCR